MTPVSNELWPVGRQFAAFAPASGAIAILNATAVDVWKLCATDPDELTVSDRCAALWGIAPAKAHGIVSDLLSCWRTAGLLQSGIATRKLPSSSSHSAEIDVGVYVTPAGRFRIRCEDAAAAHILSSVLAPLRALPGSDARETSIEIFGHADTYFTVRDGVALTQPGNISFARHEALRQLLIDPTTPDPSSAILHAAAVQIGDRAVVIAGDCGRGKSTLTACLVHDGARYVGDDLLALDRTGTWLGVCPVALSVKIGSWSVVRPLFSSRLWSDEIRINNYRVRYVDLSHRAPLEQRVPIGAIVFPNFVAGSPFSAEAIEPERSLQILLQSGSRTAGPLHSMEGLCRLADRTPAWKLTYGDWRDAARFIAERSPDRRS